MCRIEDITNFHGSLTFEMVKMFQYFESPFFAILLNSFYFSIFAFMEMYTASFALGYIAKCAKLKTLRIFKVH